MKKSVQITMLAGVCAAFICGCASPSADTSSAVEMRSEIRKLIREEMNSSANRSDEEVRPVAYQVPTASPAAAVAADPNNSSILSSPPQESAAIMTDAALLKARAAYFESNTNLAPDIKKAIQENKLVIGMTTDEIRLSWREPKSIVQTVGDAGIIEFWDYGNDHFLTVSDGALKFWHTAVGR